MILALLVLILVAAALLAWLLGRWSALAAKLVALLALAADLALGIVLWVRAPGGVPLTGGRWIEQLRLPWIPGLGIDVYLAADGLSVLMVLLTALMGLVAVAYSWGSIRDRVGFFFFQLLLLEGGLMGVFLALDLFLFYFFWEMMLIPTYFLIIVWGHENRRAAGARFFLFTQAGGLLMLLAILSLYFLHGAQTGEYTFDALRLVGTALSRSAGLLVMLGFFAAFAVKLPAFPFHSWLPDAYTEAPMAGSLLLAAVMSKTGAYGLIRFALPLFPEASARMAPWAMGLAVAGILYGGVAAFRQDDLKRLIAYTSLSHLGFVLLGIYAGSLVALEGAVFQMVLHGLSTGALFALAGVVQQRLGQRDMQQLGGLWSAAPRFAGTLLFFALAAMGLPGLGNFIGEFLVLLGTFREHVAYAVLGAAGMVVSVVYALTMVRRTLLGPLTLERPAMMVDLRAQEMVVMAAVMVLILFLGFYPQVILQIARPFLELLPYGRLAALGGAL
jgi:NADH-quinone oxidoreductase subunit M